MSVAPDGARLQPARPARTCRGLALAVDRWMRLAVSLVLVAACSGSHDNAPDASVDAPLADAAPPLTTFAYKPGWNGVVSVSVVGAPVGASGPWATLAALTDDGSGTFSGTATLAPGEYDYLFQIIGDADAGTKAMT